MGSRWFKKPVFWLIFLIGSSFAFRFSMAWCLKPLPTLFPDEYIYSSLARSLWHGHVAIRGQPFPFRQLLEPLLTAPIWALPNPVIAYHLIQALHSLLVSLTAIPVYVLGRKLALTQPKALLAAGLTLAVPELTYAGYITTEATSYLLFSCAFLCGCCCLAVPRARTQALFILLAGLSIFERMQFVVIPIAFLCAALLFGVLEYKKRWYQILKEQKFVFLFFAMLAIVAAIFDRTSAGSYQYALALHQHLLPAIGWIATNLYEMFWATGIVVLPLAGAGIVLVLVRPSGRLERAFATFAVLLIGGVLIESAYATYGDANIMFGRYLFYLSPLLIIGAFLYMKSELLWLWLPAALSIAGIVTTLRLPFAHYTPNLSESPFLQAVAWLDHQFGVPFITRPYFFPLAAFLSLTFFLAAAANQRRLMTTILAVGAGMIMLSTSVVACLYDYDYARPVALSLYVKGNPNWVKDSVGNRKVTLFAFGPEPFNALVSMFWNPEIRLVAAPTLEVDNFPHLSASISDAGVLRAGGRPIRTPLLIIQDQGLLQLDQARLVAHSAEAYLWVPKKEVQFQSLTIGYYPIPGRGSSKGWLAAKGRIIIWPTANDRKGYLSFTLSGRKPDGDKLQISYPGHSVTISLSHQKERKLHIPVCIGNDKPWVLQFQATGPLRGAAILNNQQLVSVQTTPPRFKSDTHACPFATAGAGIR